MLSVIAGFGCNKYKVNINVILCINQPLAQSGLVPENHKHMLVILFHLPYATEFLLVALKSDDICYNKESLADVGEDYVRIWSAAIQNDISAMGYVGKSRKLIKNYPNKKEFSTA